MAHELGHSMGASHDPEAVASPGRSRVAGFWTARIGPPGGHAYGDIMSYSNAHCTKAQYQIGDKKCYTTRWFSSENFKFAADGGFLLMGSHDQDNVGHVISKHNSVAGWCPDPPGPVQCAGQANPDLSCGQNADCPVNRPRCVGGSCIP